MLSIVELKQVNSVYVYLMFQENSAQDGGCEVIFSNSCYRRSAADLMDSGK